MYCRSLEKRVLKVFLGNRFIAERIRHWAAFCYHPADNTHYTIKAKDNKEKATKLIMNRDAQWLNIRMSSFLPVLKKNQFSCLSYCSLICLSAYVNTVQFLVQR